MIMKTTAEWKAEIEAFEVQLRAKLESMNATQLREYVHEEHIKGISCTNPQKARDSIVQRMVNREFHGWAFRCTD